MASTHKSLRSGTANKRPTTSIADGQIALNTNTTSPGLFFKDSTGATIIKVGPVHVGTTAPNASPAAGGSAGNSVGEIWLDTSLTPVGVKIWNGSAFVNATPVGSTTVQGLLELATNAETQTGTDPDRAVTPAGLQSKVSDSTSTTSSTTIASSTAVKSAYDLANAALPKSGGTVTGNLEIGTTGSLSFEGATADNFETTIAVVDPTADRTITLPDTTGTVVTTGDTGTVTGTMIASGTVSSSNIVDGTIVDGDISASAEIAVSKLADGTARQLLQTDAAGTGVEWASNIDVPGTLDVTSTATFDSIASHPLGSAAAPTLTFTGDTNTGIYSPGADQVAISTAGSGRLFIDSSGRVGVGTSVPDRIFHVSGAVSYPARLESSGPNVLLDFKTSGSGAALSTAIGVISDAVVVNTNSTERFRITSAGLVGIGTSSPANLLHLYGSAALQSIEPSATTVPSYIKYTGGGSDRAYLGLERGDGNGGIIGSGAGYAFVAATASTNPLILGTNSTERLRITSAGNVGIGTAAPNGLLALGFADAGSASLEFRTTSYSNLAQIVASNPSSDAGDLTFRTRTGGSAFDRAKIDSSGRLLVGTSSYSSAATAVLQGNSSAPTEDAVFRMNRGGTPGANADLGLITFGDNAGNVGASIRATNDTASSWGSGDYPGRLTFSTTADGASSPTERMRISNDGDVGIGVTPNTERLRVKGATSNNSTQAIYIANSSDTDLFYINNDGALWTGGAAESPYNSTTATAANAVLSTLGGTGRLQRSTSSLRYKKNVETLEDSFADAILSIRPVWYQSACSGDNPEWGHWGFIAEEVAEIDPRLVHWKTHESLQDKNAKPISRKLDKPLADGVQYDRFVPHLLNLIKRQKEQIEAMEARLAALESA